MSVSSSVGDFDLNVVKVRKPIEFADGSVQSTALPVKSFSNYTSQTYNLTQPNWNATIANFTNLPIGIYTLGMYYRLFNLDTAPVSWNYLEISVNEAPSIIIQQIRNADFTLPAADDLSDAPSFTFANPAVQDVNVKLISAITSGAFASQAPQIIVYQMVLVRLTDEV